MGRMIMGMNLTKRELGAIQAEKYLHMDHDCRSLGIGNCPIHAAELHEDGEVAVIELQWPERSHDKWLDRQQNNKMRSSRVIEVGLNDVRAADSIRIHYDFDRDGYVIMQAAKFSFEVDEPFDMQWQGVAFVQAWAREQKDPTA